MVIFSFFNSTISLDCSTKKQDSLASRNTLTFLADKVKQVSSAGLENGIIPMPLTIVLLWIHIGFPSYIGKKIARLLNLFCPPCAKLLVVCFFGTLSLHSSISLHLLYITCLSDICLSYFSSMFSLFICIALSSPTPIILTKPVQYIALCFTFPIILFLCNLPFALSISLSTVSLSPLFLTLFLVIYYACGSLHLEAISIAVRYQRLRQLGSE